MANNKTEIGDIVKKCKILLLDVEGTTTSISFVKDKLFPYAEENVKQFLDSQWETEDVKEAVNALRKLALEDQEKSVDGAVAIPGEDASKEDQIEGLVNNVKWQMSSDRKVGALKQLQGLIWKQGYDSGDIKGHVYDDVSPALEQWHSVDGQKVYIYSSGSVQAQKLLFGQSLAGDLLKYIDGHFDTAVGGKQEDSSYKGIVEKIGCKVDDVLFLTDIVKEAEAAKKAGLQVALVSREGNAPLPEDAIANYPVIQSLAQLTVSNKRKTDPQDEQPAKVPKTESADIKASETVTETAKVETEKPKEEAEKMDVDDAVAEAADSNEKVETVIEEVTDMKDVDAPVCDVEPIVTEANVDKPEETKAEVMETEVVNGSHEATTKVEKVVTEVPESKEEKAPMETEDVPKDQTEVKEDNGPVAEETPPTTVITEIEEITNDKEALSEVAEIIEDLEPVVEEPATAAEMENLQNVGEELEKECDEILSKVQDVTNLENINVKPILNPIAEEAMEAENGVDKASEEVKPSEVTNGEGTKDAVDEAKIEEKPAPVSESSTESTETASNKEKAAPETKQDESKQTDKSKDTKETESSVEKSSDTVSEVVKSSENNTDKKAESNDTSVDNKPEVQLNGDAKNGAPESVNQNGVEKEDEISARLSAANGNGKAVNGSNGDSNDSVKSGDSKVEEVAEIKTKTLAAEEPRPDPIEQATEA